MMAGLKERLLAWVEDQGDLDTVSKFILYKLAQFADAECCGWAAVKTLAASVNKSERTVQYRLREMEEAGLIEKTGRDHMTAGKYPRPVPIYRLAPHVEGLGRVQISGAESAPEGGLGCKNRGSRVQLSAPVYEPKEPTEEVDTSSERAREPADGREVRLAATFAAIEAAYPKLGLGFTDRSMAWAALLRLDEAGEDVSGLAEAAGRYAADPILRKRDYGPVALQRWLAEGRYRGWLPDPATPSAEASAPAGPADLPPDVAKIFEPKGADWRRSWLRGAVWREADRTLLLRGTTAMDRVERELGVQLRSVDVRLGLPPPRSSTSSAPRPTAPAQDPDR